MAFSLNFNSSAASAASSVNKVNAERFKTFSRLSSGSKFSSSADDSAGQAVSVKFTAQISNSNALQSNIGNAASFLQTQNGALKSAGEVLSQISTLATLYNDPTKSASDKADYQAQFSQLQGQLSNITGGTFNSVSLFGSSSAANNTLPVTTSVDGAQVDVSKTVLDNPAQAFSVVQNSANDLSSLNTNTINAAIDQIASAQAQNGASTSRLQSASDQLTTTTKNLQAANSQIADADVAKESTQLASENIKNAFSTAVLAQANVSQKNVLALLLK